MNLAQFSVNNRALMHFIEVLLLVAGVFSYFSLDTATRGFYTGRLQFLAAIAILALIGAGLYFARLITWV